jgi:N-methylhydantoinase B
VLRDVRAGYVSAVAAGREYGVAIAGDAVDPAATAALRAGRATAAGLYAFGSERLAHEAVWTQAAYAEMGRAMAAVPLHWRPFLKHALFEAMGKVPAPDPVAKLRAALATLAAQHPALAGMSEPG